MNARSWLRIAYLATTIAIAGCDPSTTPNDASITDAAADAPGDSSDIDASELPPGPIGNLICGGATCTSEQICVTRGVGIDAGSDISETTTCEMPWCESLDGDAYCACVCFGESLIRTCDNRREIHCWGQ